MHKLTIFQINDTHGYLEPHPELIWTGARASYPILGGYARIAALLEIARRENPGGVLALDNGDTFHGTYPAVASRGEALIPLVNALRRARCVRLQVSLDARIDFLLDDYIYAIHDTAWLASNIERLHSLQSRATLERWNQFIAAREFRLLVAELLTLHYDPLYMRSQNHNYAEHRNARAVKIDDLSATTLNVLAQEMIAGRTSD